ncbi:TPA: hypothetical protein HA265_00115 [Candidatus Woesearchaeota archaeon]|nr:hypothetical protein [Candidatus Woesearchaeota archaeon]
MTENHEKKHDTEHHEHKEHHEKEHEHKEHHEHTHQKAEHHKKHEETHHAHKHEEETETKSSDEDDVVFDLSKVKNWFSGKKQKKEHKTTHQETRAKESEEDELKFDWQATQNFFKRYGTIFLILIPVILTIYIRLLPMQLPVTDDWSRSTVENYYKNQIASQIQQQYPNLPDQNKQTLLTNEFEKFKQQNKEQLDQQIAQTSQQFKERMMYESGDSKYVYLGDIDSYYWLRDARKIIEKGVNCDEVDYEKGLCYKDTYTAAPLKTPIPLEKLYSAPYVHSIVYTYKIMKAFNEDITIMQASFYVPTIYAVISVILAFLIGLAVAGKLAGLIASIFITFNPVFLSRTLGSDNDPQNMLFPLLIVLFFIHTLKAEDLKFRALYAGLTGLSIGLFSWAWQGWWFMFDFLVGTLLALMLHTIIKQVYQTKNLKNLLRNQQLKTTAVNLLMIIGASAVFITIWGSSRTLLNAIISPLWFLGTKVATHANFWPNVLVTVAEFNEATFSQIISQIGGKTIFFIGLMGLAFLFVDKEKVSKDSKYLLAFAAAIYLFLSSEYGMGIGKYTYISLIALPIIVGIFLTIKRKEQTAEIGLSILLCLWFAATIFAALKGIRFTLLLVGVFGVSFAIALSAVSRLVSKWLNRELKINTKITYAIASVLILLLMMSTAKAGYETAKGFVPSVNDAWYNSLTKIRDNSQPDAIINSWWDFGHWFKYIADRRVTLDGSSQGGAPIHWLGKLMTVKDEKVSAGILRMLDCGSNNAFEELNKVVKDTANSVKILDKIIVMEKGDAEKTLKRLGLKDEQVSAVLQNTHCEPPEDFFITSEDMVGKAGVWGHFGSWNFARAEMYQTVKGKGLGEGMQILTQEKFNLTKEQAEKYYYEIQSQDGNQWISPWPGYLSNVANCRTPTADGKITCIQNAGGQQMAFEVDLNTMDVVIANAQGATVRPTSVVYITETGTEEKEFIGDVIGASIILIPTNGGYQSLLSHPLLANSIFTRLFYLEGHGLKYFDKFSDAQGVTGGRVIVWKVDWEGKDANKPFTPSTKTEPDPELLETENEIQEGIENLQELAEMEEEIQDPEVDKQII